MAFNGSEGAPIELKVAALWTKNYRDQPGSEILGHFFGREILEQLLAQTGCEGIRLYYGLDENGSKQILAVGADADEDDQLDSNCIVADNSMSSPPHMGTLNQLNHDTAATQPD